MGAFADLFKSERGLLTVLLVIGVTTLCAIGKLDADAWTAYTKWALVTYTAGKTVTGVVSAITGKDSDGVPAIKTTATTSIVSPGVTTQGVVGLAAQTSTTTTTDKKGA